MTGQIDFFKISKEDVLSRLDEEVVDFYRKAEYLDLTAGPLYVSSDLIRKKGKIIDNIDRIGGKDIVKRQELQLPSVALMYKVIIPYLNVHASQNGELNKVLESMNTNPEFLEDIVIQTSSQDMHMLKLKVGEGKEVPITLPHKTNGVNMRFWDYEVSGAYNLKDINAFGFPTILRENGEFRYYGPTDFNMPIGRELYLYGGGPQGQVATIRDGNLGLLLNFRPRGDVQDHLGVRGVKVE